MTGDIEQFGPVYGVRLLTALPRGIGAMKQAMPSKEDLQQVQAINERTVAGFEALTAHYIEQVRLVSSLRSVIERVIAGEWSVTELQEIIGQLDSR